MRNNGEKMISRRNLSSSNPDILAYIQLKDTKVSIIMGVLIALIAGILACYYPIFHSLSNIKLGCWLRIINMIVGAICCLSIIGVFTFGILTIRRHSSSIRYKSK